MAETNKQTFCRFYGSNLGCKFGDLCRFSHANPNTVPMCKYIQNNEYCQFGPKCYFRHDGPSEVLQKKVTFHQVKNIEKKGKKGMHEEEEEKKFHKEIQDVESIRKYQSVHQD